MHVLLLCHLLRKFLEDIHFTTYNSNCFSPAHCRAKGRGQVGRLAVLCALNFSNIAIITKCLLKGNIGFVCSVGIQVLYKFFNQRRMTFFPMGKKNILFKFLQFMKKHKYWKIFQCPQYGLSLKAKV